MFSADVLSFTVRGVVLGLAADTRTGPEAPPTIFVGALAAAALVLVVALQVALTVVAALVALTRKIVGGLVRAFVAVVGVTALGTMLLVACTVFARPGGSA